MENEQLLEALRESPAVRQAEEELRKRSEGERAAAAKIVAECRARLKKELPPLQAKVEAAKAAVTKARKALREAEREERDMRIGELRLRTSQEHQIARHERALRDTADPAIDVFKAELNEEWEQSRRERVRIEEKPSGEWDRSGLPLVHTYTNSEALANRMVAIRAAIAAAEALKLEVGIDVAGELRKLRSGLPSADRMEKVR